MCASTLSIDTITPGESTYDDVIAQYGPPDDEDVQGDIRYLLYQSSPTAYDAVGLRDDRVMVLAIYPPQPGATPEDYVPGLGDPELSYYSEYGHGARILAYPSQGITFVVTAKGIVVQVMYTAPMSADEYQAQLGHTFPADDPFGHDI
jgi:hypothetical protein